MKSRFCLIFCFVALIANPGGFVRADELYLEFLQGLRERNYFDFAILYLDQLSQRPSLPPEIKPVLLFQKAITLRESSNSIRSAEKQTELLDQALGFLEQFASEYPTHPYAGDANFQRAQILLQKAMVDISQIKSPANKGSKSELQKRGRELIRKAREVLNLAHEQHDAASKAFPAFIDEQKDPKLAAERDNVMRHLVIEASDLARCTYQEAQTYDPSAREFKSLLNDAAEAFEKVYLPHRNQVGGQLARAWQGKCFEEMGDLQKALGIYNEILEQPEDDPSFQSLKAQTLLFKLICLRGRDENQLVVDQADEWLKKNASESRTSVGLGIQWEQAQAYEELGDNRNLPKPDQVRYWRQARTTAQNIGKFAGEYKDFSVVMLQRLQNKLGEKVSRPDSFESAYAAAEAAYTRSKELAKELDSVTKGQHSAEELLRLNQDRSNELSDASRNFELALTLVNRGDNPKLVAGARYLQALTNYHLKRYYEAAVLGEFVARTTPDDDSGMALDAAYVAMLSFHQAFVENRADLDKKRDDLRLVIKAANYLTERWPESDKANEARMTLGRMYGKAKQPAEAAEWFSKVPESDSKFTEAQIGAGQAYWDACGSAFRLAPELRPTPEKLTEWKALAEKYLRTGIEKLSAGLPKDGAIPGALLSAKMYLAEILLNQSKASDAVKVIVDDPQSLIKAVSVPDESQRPATGPQSRSVAKQIYKLLLRGYINMGSDKLDAARDTMKTLEAIAAGDPGADLTDLYVGLGRELKKELEQFRANGETEQFNRLMDAFELFLSDMSKKQDGQTLGSLTWIGETYMTLGEIANDRSKSGTFYERAASALDRIVSRSQAEAGFVGPDQLLSVKNRLIHCNRLKKDFAGAEQMLKEVLKARPNDLKAQVEGASVYQDWGSNGEQSKLVIAINGNKESGLWGWGGIANRISKQKNYTEKQDMVDTLLDARYNVTLCRFRYAKEIGPKEKPKALEACLKELTGTASFFAKTITEEKRTKLNELYRDVLREAGKPVSDLPRFEDGLSEPPPPQKGQSTDEHDPVKGEEPETTSDTKPPKEEPKKSEVKEEPQSDWITWVVVLLGLAGGGGAIARVVLTAKKPKPKKKSTTVQSPAAPIGFTGIAFDKDTEKEKSLPPSFTVPTTKTAAPKPRPKPASASGAAPPATPSAQRPASRPATRPDAGTSPPPKPRPKPPAPPSNQ